MTDSFKNVAVPAPEVEMRPADERWSFARRCVQAGYDIYANHATAGDAQEYERISAEIDAKASEMAEPHHSPRGLCNDCGNEIEREAGSLTHCRRCVRLRDLEHELSELRASSAPAEPLQDARDVIAALRTEANRLEEIHGSTNAGDLHRAADFIEAVTRSAPAETTRE